MLPLSVRVNHQLLLCIPVTGSPLPELVLSHRIQALNTEQILDDENFDRSEEASGSDDEHLSDATETPEQTEEMSYRETVRSVHSYMGWHHIPTFETTYSEPDKSNNPWKGKNPRKPTRVSVAMPPDDWLCQKLERLNLTAIEGYPSSSQDSAGLKRDQFIKVPKSQSKWYTMHLLKPDGPHRPGRSVFNWRNTEAKVNSQFPRLTKASACPSTGPPSRPVSQESRHRWERAAREDSYIVNHAVAVPLNFRTRCLRMWLF